MLHKQPTNKRVEGKTEGDVTTSKVKKQPYPARYQEDLGKEASSTQRGRGEGKEGKGERRERAKGRGERGAGERESKQERRAEGPMQPTRPGKNIKIKKGKPKEGGEKKGGKNKKNRENKNKRNQKK